MKICTVIGARPQFVKASVVSEKISKLRNQHNVQEVIIHTGQHYDTKMSDIFFNELSIPKEKYNLNTGSGSHGTQTAKMLEDIEKVLKSENPDLVLIYGDTNSTLAGVLAAVKLHIKVAHVEAGMRSFNRQMPEEINRVVADHLCELNLCSTNGAVENLKNEGRGHTAFLTGDVMYDCAMKFAAIAEKISKPLERFKLEKGKFILMTCHRAENTDDCACLTGIVNAVNALAKNIKVLYPIHPRTRKMLNEYKLNFIDNVQVVDPVGYFEMLILEKSAALILTDSGGVQKEAFFYKVPCVTMRNETEWLETVEFGFNRLTGAVCADIISSVEFFLSNPLPVINKQPYGNADAADKIVRLLLA
jgi:UDP-GlcNAc3NAcA epimerase